MLNRYWAKKWASLSGKQKAMLYNPGNMLKREAILGYIFHYSQPTETTRILDVGGGLGDLGLEFFKRGQRGYFIVLDISMAALLEAKTTLQYFTCGFIQAGAQKLPLKSKTFDIVICSEVLEHLPDDSIALKEITRVLKDNGIIIITVPYMEAWDPKLYEQYVLVGGHLRTYDLYLFHELCRNAQLEIKDISFHGRSIQVIRDLLRKLFKREGMGEKESVLYSKASVISRLLVSILKPVDNVLANKPRFSGFFKVLERGSLVACLAKARR
jgi:ubiquinone/menaquinone biosynthesis C-methylase UbiE